MSPLQLIAWRFLSAARRTLAMGVVGIALGVAFFILTQAQTSGFEKFFIKTILGTNGAIRVAERFQQTEVALDTGNGVLRVPSVSSYTEGVDYPEKLRQAIEGYRHVTAVSEIVEGKADASFGGRSQSVSVNGIRLLDQLKVSHLSGQIVEGDLSDFEAIPNPVVVGVRLAKRMNLRVGSSMILRASADQSILGKVVAIFETGVGDLDLQRVYIPLNTARTLLKKPFGGAYLQISLDDPAAAPAIAKSISSAYGYHAIPWQEREKVWLEVFQALRISAALTVSSILVIASMGIFNTLAMMVLEKTRQIAILGAMGFARADIRKIFLWQGLFLGGTGITAGLLLGAAATGLVSSLPIRIRGIFSADHFIVSWDLSHYLLAAGLAALAVMLATLLPANRASKLLPADILRSNSL